MQEKQINIKTNIKTNINNNNNNINPFIDDEHLTNNTYFDHISKNVTMEELDELLNQYTYNEKSKEWHLPFHNFIGPGTHILTRLKNGVKPINKADAAALIHDVEYLNPYIDERDADITALDNAGGGNGSLQKLMWLGFTIKNLAGGYNSKKDYKQYQLALALINSKYKDVLQKYNLRTTPYNEYYAKDNK